MNADEAVAWFADMTGLVPATFNQLDYGAAKAGVARKRMRAADVTAAVERLQAARAADGLPPLPVERGNGPLERIAAETQTTTAPPRRPKAWGAPRIIEGLATRDRPAPTRRTAHATHAQTHCQAEPCRPHVQRRPSPRPSVRHHLRGAHPPAEQLRRRT